MKRRRQRKSPRSGAVIKAARQAAGLSQTELVRRIARLRKRDQSKIMQPHVSAWERDAPSASFPSFCRIAAALGLSAIQTADGVRFVEPGAVQLPPEGD